MGYTCDFCGDQRCMVYCRSDDACLCLSCDHNVHSANILSKRPSRTLICERCNSQPAFVRCVEERVYVCQNCDWMGHGASTSPSAHKRQSISCYSGCPSAAELSSICSFVLDFPSSGESICEEEMGLMSIHENSTGNAQTPENESSSIGLNDSSGKGKAIFKNAMIGSTFLITWAVIARPPLLLQNSPWRSPQPRGPRWVKRRDFDDHLYMIKSILVDSTLYTSVKLMEEFKAGKHAEWDPNFEIGVWCKHELELTRGVTEEEVP
ncbi:hypothetical protein UlMin_009832 [Ulmus minor]